MIQIARISPFSGVQMMPRKTPEEIRREVKRAIRGANTDAKRKAFRENHVAILSEPPYGLTLKQLIQAHNDPELNLRLDDSWQSGG